MFCNSTTCIGGDLVTELPQCGLNPMVDTCGSPMRCDVGLWGDRRTQLELYVQDVTMQRPPPVAPALGWLTGHARLLYVLVEPAGAEDLGQQTGTGILLRDMEGRSATGAEEEEVWMFGTNKKDDSPAIRGERLLLYVSPPAEIELRVLGSYMTWHSALGLRAPSEVLAEGRLGVDHCMFGSEVRVPLALDGKVVGEATIVAKRGRRRPQVLPCEPSSPVACEVPSRRALDSPPPLGGEPKSSFAEVYPV
mmetsp:Transcript_98912/g.190984  ORF Transcript_98912/g.190984 Transcript_98912/m.190984 type:complete len:250 (-) Transcript_98912:62-811(-)|eukprot:CAMPEP_0172683928 /NCGR_PEP_ID=MMETSP1074-20121228/19195_1 /TAXON_ID=2916 /ORGANISM="Ceratium fusus, Strain PA161109" /LENGTH=249 /DNA_ID=CAMNT_0013502849 /DNA_START=79 /DNA_END=828 /DNA_ORIENTATION=-